MNEVGRELLRLILGACILLPRHSPQTVVLGYLFFWMFEN